MNAKERLDIYLRILREQEIVVTESEIEENWLMLKKRIYRIRYVKLFFSVAAAVLCLIGLSIGLIAFDSETEMTLITYADATREDFVNEKDIVLITPIDKQMCGNSKMATVIQTIEGNHIVNADTVASRVTDMVKKKEKTSAFNQLIIPIGKKSRIVLSDSTEIIANSGSRIIYPIAFRENVREIYIDGEAFLTVKKNDRIPFIVYTHDYEIEVIGTSFNICSYPSEKKSTVVLLNGAINLSGINEEKVTLKPGEKVDIYEGKIEVPEKVDVKQYVSWIDNILVYKDEPLEFVLHRLGIYFGKEFEISQGVKGKSVTGKLEFKEDLFEMLDIISFTASVSFEEQGDKIIVR